MHFLELQPCDTFAEKTRKITDKPRDEAQAVKNFKMGITMKGPIFKANK